MTEHTHAKPRASRIPLDYFRKPDFWVRWKGRLTLLLVLGGLALVGWGLASPAARRAALNRGPLAGVHTAWANDCAACHLEGFSLVAEAYADARGNPCAGGPMDQRCNGCHNGGFPLPAGSPAAWAGAFHHANASPASTVACAACHHDHRGGDADLSRVPDSSCTSCHANLKPHAIDSAAVVVAAGVGAFSPGAHPPFRAQSENWKDPGSVKFNHALHLKPGMGQNYTLKQVSSAGQDKYKAYAGGEKELVSLDCAACHHLDSPSDGVSPARQAGGVFLPISFERDCKACHELAFTRDAGGGKVEVPHKIQPAEVKSFVEAVYAREFLAEKGVGKPDARPFQPPLPGKPVAGGLAPPDAAAFEKAYGGKVNSALTRLMSKAGCAECHHLEGNRVDEHAAGFGPLPLSQVVRSRIQTGFFREGSSKAAAQWLGDQRSPIPLVWQPKARFNHAAHRAWDCVTCHSGAASSISSADILLPSVETCHSCHGPSGGKSAAQGPGIAGGARHDCVECHGYHLAGGGLTGPGNRAWADPRGAVSGAPVGGGAR